MVDRNRTHAEPKPDRDSLPVGDRLHGSHTVLICLVDGAPYLPSLAPDNHTAARLKWLVRTKQKGTSHVFPSPGRPAHTYAY